MLRGSPRIVLSATTLGLEVSGCIAFALSVFFSIQSGCGVYIRRGNERTKICTHLWRAPPEGWAQHATWGIDNERTNMHIPSGGRLRSMLRRRDVHTNKNTQHTHTRAGPDPNPQAVPTSHHKTPLRKPIPQLQPMAVRVVHKLQHHPLGVARRTAPKAHTRGAVSRARAHPKQVVAQCRAVQPVVPRPRRLGHGDASAASGRGQQSLVVQAATRAPRRPRAPPVPTPPSQPPRPSDRPAHGACTAPSRAPTQRSTPDAGANARSQRAL